MSVTNTDATFSAHQSILTQPWTRGSEAGAELNAGPRSGSCPSLGSAPRPRHWPRSRHTCAPCLQEQPPPARAREAAPGAAGGALGRAHGRAYTRPPAPLAHPCPPLRVPALHAPHPGGGLRPQPPRTRAGPAPAACAVNTRSGPGGPLSPGQLPAPRTPAPPPALAPAPVPPAHLLPKAAAALAAAAALRTSAADPWCPVAGPQPPGRVRAARATAVARARPLARAAVTRPAPAGRVPRASPAPPPSQPISAAEMGSWATLLEPRASRLQPVKGP